MTYICIIFSLWSGSLTNITFDPQGLLYCVHSLEVCRDITLWETTIMVSPVTCFSPLLGQGVIPGEMHKREAKGLDDSPIVWTRVQIALIWAAAGQCAGMVQDLHWCYSKNLQISWKDWMKPLKKDSIGSWQCDTHFTWRQSFMSPGGEFCLGVLQNKQH